jgi:Fe2+ transport system protein FeoA
VDLGSLEPGARGRVRQLGGTPVLRRRLMDLGVIPGEVVVLEKIAPLGDPIEIAVKGYRLSLRRIEAAAVLVEILP